MSAKRQIPFKLGDGRMIAEEAPRRVFEVSVAVGPVIIHGLIVWRSKNGHLRVFFPQHKAPGGFNIWLDTVEVSPEMREEIEAAVITAYKNAKRQAGKPKQNEAPSDVPERTPRIFQSC